MEFIEAKTITQTVQHGDKWFGVDYNMNLYRGCCHGCIYCDSRSDCYQVDHFDTVRGKKDTDILLRKELAHRRKKGVIGIGAMSDTYSPFEKQYELTRNALKIINEFHFGVAIPTKSDLVVRDIDLLKQIKEKAPVLIKVTITTTDDKLASIIEPHAPSSTRRFQAIKQLRQAGILAGILMMPILPFINDTPEGIAALVKAAHDVDASFIYPSFGVTLRANQRTYYYDKLDELYPGLRAQYQQHYRDKYSATSLRYKELYAVFVRECKRYGIPYKMQDIIQLYKQPYEVEQLQMF